MAWLELWVTCAVLAHVFASFFLLRSLLKPGQIKSWTEKLSLLCQSCGSGVLEPVGTPRPCHKEAADAGPAAHHHTILQPVCRVQAALGISWYGVSCSYASEQKEAQVLQGALGHVPPGDLGILLGPSGSGKSTLLEVLAGRKAVGTLRGHVAMPSASRPPPQDGQTEGAHPCTWLDVAAHRAAVLRRSAFVPQEDAFPACLTAREIMLFWAAMVLPSSLRHAAPKQPVDPSALGSKPLKGSAMRRVAVHDALASMGLLGQQDTLVGGQLPGGLQIRGLSGGERKRLAVAAGCLPAPQLLLLDEPTTGLDSAAALKVMAHLRAMAAGPGGSHTVLASVHQPRAAMWDMVDSVVVLSAGQTIYAGPPSLMVGWLSGTLGYAYSPGRHGSAPDWAMDLVNVGFKKPKRFSCGRTLETAQDLRDAAARFAGHYTTHHGRVMAPQRRVSMDGRVVPVAQASAHHADFQDAGDGPAGSTAPDQALGHHHKALEPTVPASAVLPPFLLCPRDAAHTHTEAASTDGAMGALSQAAGTGAGAPPPLRRLWQLSSVPRFPAGLPPSLAAATLILQDLQHTRHRRAQDADSCNAGVQHQQQQQEVEEGEGEPRFYDSLSRWPSESDPPAAPSRLASPELLPRPSPPPATTPAAFSLSAAPIVPAPASTPSAACAAGHMPPLPPQQQLATAAACPRSSTGFGSTTHGGMGTWQEQTQWGGMMKGTVGAREDTGGEAEGQKTALGLEFGAGGGAAPAQGPLEACRTEPGGCGAGLAGNKGADAAAGRVPASLAIQVWSLCWRELALCTRNPADVAGRTLVFVWSGLVVGAVFYSLATNVHGLHLLYAESAVFFLLPFCYISLFTSEKRLYIADAAARLYSPLPYHIAKSLVMLPFAIINVMVFCGTVYGMAGLRRDLDGLPVVQHMVIALMAYLLAQQVLYCAAILTPNQDIAFMLAIAWTAVNVLLANFPLRTTEYEMAWVTPLRFLSALHFAFGGLMRAEFANGRDYSCADGLGERIVDALPNFLPQVRALRLPAVQRVLKSPGADCQIDPVAVMNFFSIQWPWHSYLGALLVYLGVLHALSFGALLLARRQERR